MASLLKVKKSSCVPGWNNSARFLKENANYLHRVWCQSSYPPTDVLHQLRSAKSRYQSEVHHLKCREK